MADATTPANTPPRRALLRDFGRLLLIAVVLPALILAGLNLWQGALAAKERSAAHLAAVAEAASRDIDNFLRRHLVALQVLADHRTAIGNVHDLEAWTRDLRRVHRYYPDFNTLAVVDGNGRLVLTEPASPAAPGSSVADRSYFSAPRRSGRAHVSNAYRGRVVSDLPSAAVSAPFFANGRFAGVVGGAIRVDAFPPLQRYALRGDGLELLVLDRNDTVVYATEGLPVRSLDVLVGTGAHRSLRQLRSAGPDQQMQFVPDALRDGGDAYGLMRPLADGWRVLVLVPEQSVLAELAMNTAVMLGMLALTLLGVFVVVRAQMARLSGHVHGLLERMQRFALDRSAPAPVPGDVPRELVPLWDALNQLAERAHRAYEDVSESLQQQSRLREDLQAMARSLLTVQENERRTLSRELHDDVGQAITAIKLGAMALQDEADDARRGEILAEIIGITDQTVTKLRNLSMLLRPPQLDTLGLETALRWQAETLFRSGRPLLDMRLSSLPDRPDPEVELACFRIAQEALTNTLRHSGATQVTLTLVPDEDGRQLRLSVADDGRGFQPESGHGLGLVTMRERARQLGGSLHIDASPGAGTRVSAVLPMHVDPSTLA